MPLSAYHEYIEEVRPPAASIGFEEWTLYRKFRVVGRADVPPLSDVMLVSCPGVPPLGSTYVDFASHATVPNAFLIDYNVEQSPNVREGLVTCVYSTRPPTTRNAGGLQTPVGTAGNPNQPGGGSSNPADLTQLLPKVSKGVEIVRVPYKYDPQDAAFYTDAAGNILAGGFLFSRYSNTTGENFAAGAVQEIAMPVYRVSLYKLTDRDTTLNGNSVNSALWDSYPAKSLYNKPETTSRELVAGNYFWLWNFEIVYDPIFFHRFRNLNAGFRELASPVAVNNNISTRTLQDIILNGQKTTVEVPLNINGQKITDPGRDGANLIFANFNKYDATDFTTLPFTLSQFGFE